jgi:hypothetical protein
MTMSVVQRIVVPAVAAIALASALLTTVDAAQEAEARKGVVIRGCLTGSKLTHIDPRTELPADLARKLPDKLMVTSIRVIRDQVKALNGHQVEITGALRGIPGMETGILVAESGNAKLYLGGGDPTLGSDLSVARYEPPTIYAQMITEVAAACDPVPPKP